jgi:hypothetical protein
MRRYAEIVRRRAVLHQAGRGERQIATSAFNPARSRGLHDPERKPKADFSTLRQKEGSKEVAAGFQKVWTA